MYVKSKQHMFMLTYIAVFADPDSVPNKNRVSEAKSEFIEKEFYGKIRNTAVTIKYVRYIRII